MSQGSPAFSQADVVIIIQRYVHLPPFNLKEGLAQNT